MVRKTDALARVLRPGESMALGRKGSEFEIVLFRPRHHVRREEIESQDGAPDVNAGSYDRDSASRDAAANAGGGVAAVAGNKVKFAIGPSALDATHADKKRTATTLLSPSKSTSPGREAAVGSLTEEASGSPMGRRGSNGSYDVTAAELAAEAPLFFDTTVCIFYDELTKMDYVATGRTTADSKGIHYIPHAVVLGDELGVNAYCNYNITRPDGEALADEGEEHFDDDDDVLVSRNAANNGPISMAAADGVSVNMRRLATCSGFLVCATLFSRDSSLHRERNVFYMIRKPRSPTPLCLIPFCITGDSSKSCVSLMIRRVRAHGDAMWEAVNVSEGLPLQDVKSLVLSLQNRGLKDPAHFTRDFELKGSAAHANDESYGGTDDDRASSSIDSSGSDLGRARSPKHHSEAQEQERSWASETASRAAERHGSVSHQRNCRTFSGLLVDVPRVTREGRRQYNVGRSHVQSNLFDSDTSEEDEVLDDAMRAVVPCYANTSLIRYENGAYNVGSRAENLVTHYVDHRETYGLDAAGHRHADGGKAGITRETLLPLLSTSRGRQSADWGTPIPVLDRCQVDDSPGVPARPELPADLLVTSEDRRLAVATQQHRGSLSAAIKKRQSTAGRARRSSSLRGLAARKGTSRPSSTAATAPRGSQPRKKGDGKAARAKPAVADAAARPEELRDADGRAAAPAGSRDSDPSPSRSDKAPPPSHTSGGKQKASSAMKRRVQEVK